MKLQKWKKSLVYGPIWRFSQELRKKQDWKTPIYILYPHELTSKTSRWVHEKNYIPSKISIEILKISLQPTQSLHTHRSVIGLLDLIRFDIFQRSLSIFKYIPPYFDDDCDFHLLLHLHLYSELSKMKRNLVMNHHLLIFWEI